jgi:hypothetical protein
MSIEDTMRFVASLHRASNTPSQLERDTHPKAMKTRCASVPQRVPMISRNVCAYGAFNFSFAASCVHAPQYPILLVACAPAAPARTEALVRSHPRRTTTAR